MSCPKYRRGILAGTGRCWQCSLKSILKHVESPQRTDANEQNHGCTVNAGEIENFRVIVDEFAEWLKPPDFNKPLYSADIQ
jgi:hypothetical protein